MPALPGKISRRKVSTPRAKLEQDDVWKRTFKIMGLEPLSSGNQMAAMEPATDISSPTPEPSLAQGLETEKKKKKKKMMMMNILDLPSEIQKDIFKYSNTIDLIALSLVSKHFRDIAAEQLYHSFHIVFPDEDDPSSSELPIDALAGGLDTFVTSDYDYAQHLREIVLESLSGGDKGEHAYRQYLYDASCGKFMNTLLLLTLRKAKVLETFKWDIRVELSREVFKALHGIRPLQHLHLRMQVGQSIYQPPPNIQASHTTDGWASMGMLSPPPHHNAPPFTPMPPGFPGSSTNSFSLGSKISTKIHQKNIKSLLPAMKQVPPTLSGFKDLKTLAVLDMDTLDYASEIKTCIANSCTSLSSLKLSFSDALANKSRKPPPEVLSDDESDQEDEFGQGILPPGPPPMPAPSGIADPNGPSNALKAQEEKKRQEGFLAKIFGMEKAAVLKPKASPSPTIDKEPEPISIDELRKKFLKTLAPVTLKLFSTAKDSQNLGPEEADVLDIIKKFAHVTDAIRNSEESQSQQQQGSGGSSTAKATPASSSASADGRAESDTLSGTGGERGLFDEPMIKKKQGNADSEVSNPDDIDVEEPEGRELALDSEPTALEASTDSTEDVTETRSLSLPMDNVAWANRIQVLESQIATHASAHESMTVAEKLKKRVEKLRNELVGGKLLQDSDKVELEALEKTYATYKLRLDEVTRGFQDLGYHTKKLMDERQTVASEQSSSEMSQYVRRTRGLTLTTLGIYLIPIKATILSRAIDLAVLQNITLLNVGHQTPFWNIMARENKLSPLPLHKIHTDNVTLPFLAFVSQLDNMTELLLLERTQKATVESTTAKTTVTMEQIRRVILKKHAATLKVLMLRNEAGTEWDMNAKTAMLLCQRAKLLEELAVSFGVRTMHTFLQFMPGLASLRAFHTIQFRTDDTCMWVCREFRKFTVDNISHNPGMKLEYIALDNSVERLIRRVPAPKKKIDIKGKGKEIDGGAHGSSKKAFAQLVLGSSVWPDGMTMSPGLALSLGASGLDSVQFLEDSEDEDGGASWGFGLNGKTALKVETMEGMRFCDVMGVRIFEKDVLGGRL